MGDSVFYETLLPVAWQEREHEPEPSELIQAHTINREIFSALHVIDDVGGEAVADNENRSENLHVEAKLNLLINMVSILLRWQQKPPPEVMIKMGSEKITWFCLKPPVLDQWLQVQIYVCGLVPQPLSLFGRCQAVQAENDGFLVSLTLLKMEGALQEEFEKFIFRQHLRSIAQLRRRISQDG